MPVDSFANAPYCFVSYASADRERVLRVVDALEGAGVSCWIDRDGIEGGANYGLRIAQAIESSSLLILMSSKDALASRNVRQEVALAWKYDRPYLPLRLDLTPVPAELDYWLEASQWIDVLDNPIDDWLPRVLRAIMVLDPSLSTAVPQRPSRTTTQSNLAHAPLPAPLTPLVGRETEIEQISALLGQARLITLAGPGGTGKTRLALEVAHRVEPQFADGVAWIDLAPLRDVALVMPAIASALGIQPFGSESYRTIIQHAIGTRHLLLVIDNWEQVVEAAGELGALLTSCPNLSVLATSRITLRISGERLVGIDPLALPVDSRAWSLDDLALLRANPAIDLFLQRATAVKAEFRLTPENAGAVAGICRRVDGLPLAIELAASRIRVLSPQDILRRLEHPLAMLAGGSRDLPERQQTVRKTIQWSHDLMSHDAQCLFRRLAVFADGWSLPAAEAVASGDDDLTIDVLDGLTALVEHSLTFQREGPDGEARFGMLETIREFALEQLTVAGELETLRRHHARYFADLVEQVESRRISSGSVAPYRAIDRDYLNIHAALEWAAEHDGDVALRMSANLPSYWDHRGRVLEGAQWLEHVLANFTDTPAPRRQAALTGLGSLFRLQGRFDDAGRALAAAMDLYDEENDPLGAAQTLNALGGLEIHLRRHDDARRHLERSLELRRMMGDRRSHVVIIGNLGALRHLAGDYDAAERLYTEARRIADETGEETAGGIALVNLAELAFDRGRHNKARTLAMDCARIAEQQGRMFNLAYAWRLLARIELASGDLDAALAYISRSLRLHTEMDALSDVTEDLRALLDVLWQRGSLEETGLALGVLRTLLDRLPAPPFDVAELDTVRRGLAEALGADTAGSLIERGAGMAVSEVAGLLTR